MLPWKFSTCCHGNFRHVGKGNVRNFQTLRNYVQLGRRHQGSYTLQKRFLWKQTMTFRDLLVEKELFDWTGTFFAVGELTSTTMRPCTTRRLCDCSVAENIVTTKTSRCESSFRSTPNQIPFQVNPTHSGTVQAVFTQFVFSFATWRNILLTVVMPPSLRRTMSKARPPWQSEPGHSVPIALASTGFPIGCRLWLKLQTRAEFSVTDWTLSKPFLTEQVDWFSWN